MRMLNRSTKLAIAAFILILLSFVVNKTVLRGDAFSYLKLNIKTSINAFTNKKIIVIENDWLYNATDSVLPNNAEKNNTHWRYYSTLTDSSAKYYKSIKWLTKKVKLPSLKNLELIALIVHIPVEKTDVFINGKFFVSFGMAENENCANCFKSIGIPASWFKSNAENEFTFRVANWGETRSNSDSFYKIKVELEGTVKQALYLDGNWKFQTGDSVIWKEKTCNENNFRSIFVPRTWDDQGYKKYDGIAWYRKQFVCPKELQNKELVLLAGKIDDVHEVYMNGTKIGGNIKQKELLTNEFWQFNYYRIAPYMLTDTNTIAIKVIDYKLNGGIYEGPVGISTIKSVYNFLDFKIK